MMQQITIFHRNYRYGISHTSSVLSHEITFATAATAANSIVRLRTRITWLFPILKNVIFKSLFVLSNGHDRAIKKQHIHERISAKFRLNLNKTNKRHIYFCTSNRVDADVLVLLSLPLLLLRCVFVCVCL